MKKICYIVTLPLTIRAFFISQLKYLAKEYDVTVICSYDKKLHEDLGDDITYIAVNIPRGISLRGMLRSISEIKKILKKEQYDLIQYSTPNAAFAASVAGLLSGIKIRNYHLMGLKYLGNKAVVKYILKLLEKVSCICSTDIECVSKSNLELAVREKLFPLSKAEVVWNGSTGGVDLKKFDFFNRDEWRKEVRKRYGFLEKDFIYGYVGRITRDKGINELLESFFNLEDDSKLLLVGQLEKKEHLNIDLWEKAQKNKNVTIVDWVNDIEKYYAAIDVLVLPSYREGFGNVVIEAAAMGTPAIVSDIPGPIDAVKENVTGLICNVKDVKSLSSCMKKMQKDIGCKIMGSNAANYAKECFNSEVLCMKILDRKKKLLEKRK